MKRFKAFSILIITFTIAVACSSTSSTYKFPKSNVYFEFHEKDNGIKYTLSKDKKVLQTFTLDSSFAGSNIQQTAKGLRLSRPQSPPHVDYEIIEDSPNLILYRVTQNLTAGQSSEICLSLDIGKTHWYGGPENRYQYWPIEKSLHENYSYVSKETDNCAVTERYWLSSQALFIYVEEDTPLFIDQNSRVHRNQLCLIARKSQPYDTNESSFTFNYFVGWSHDTRESHLQAVRRFLKKPTGLPDERMVRHPIWSTWALYKVDIDEKVVQSFADNILKYKFNNSQLEIDDDWEDCYGALTFRKSKFPNIKAFTSKLKAQGFRVTLWIHPFINKNCAPWYNDALKKGYLVLDQKGNPDTQWWNSKANESAYIDFTKPEAAKWFTDRLRRLQTEDGIDSFKFDAGETSWSPPNPVLVGKRSLNPNLITSAYVRTVGKLGPMVEVRTGQGTQDVPIFIRMIDKDSEWGWNNGLTTLITTLLQLNMVGYPIVLPDMIGGNGYNDRPPNKEMFIRWLQANVFMPSLQFSYVPWQYDQETVNISLAMTELHDKYTNLFMSRFQLASSRGDPVNPPLWWADPDDVVAQGCYDQFMLGSDLIAAPVIRPGQEDRDVYLPAGRWQDGNDGTVYEGPKWLMNYPAPLQILPYFVRVP